MVGMAKSKVNISNIEWEINTLEWEIRIPEDSFDLEPAAPKSLHRRVLEKILQVFGGLKSRFISLCMVPWRHGAEDPRRIFHGMKVGLAIVLVSIFYFMDPLYDTFDDLTVWAVMTVVVVFEFSAGATLSKGLNRMVATFLGGLLAVGVNSVALQAGKEAQPFLLSFGVFIFTTLATFTRISPKHARYDYGFMIFILTYSVIAIAGTRQLDLLYYASIRLKTVLIGCGICILISLLICPIWAGEDLHKLIIGNLEGLAGSLEGCVTEYFKEPSDKDNDNDKVSTGYTRVLNSKAREEVLSNFARWEFPRHGQFGIRYPWKQYVKIGARIRYCAYCVEALQGCLNSEIQEPYFLRNQLKAPCMNIVAEASKVILELADSIKTMTRISRINLMMDRLNRAVEELQNCLKAQPGLFIDSKRWQIVEEDPQPKFINVKVMPPSKSENPQVLRIKKADCEENKKPVISSKSKIWPHTDIPVTSDDSAVDGIHQVQNNETIQDVAFMDTLSLATVACLLTKIVPRLETVITTVDELGELANFAMVVDEWGEPAHFRSNVDDKPIVDNNNAPAKVLPTNQSASPLHLIQNPAAKVPPTNQSPSPPQPMQNPATKVIPTNPSPPPAKPIQNPAVVIPAAELPSPQRAKSVRWAN